jgi:hypothetical protein
MGSRFQREAPPARARAGLGQCFNRPVHETDADLRALQDLLDRSYDVAGPHLRSIITPERRVGASELVELLTGMRLLALATVTADGRPIVGPVDGIFYRGAFHFSSGSNSLRLAHIRARPEVSATHLPSEEFAVTVHGRAAFVDVRSPEGAGLRRTLLDVYVPRYGAGWEAFLDSIGTYVRIEARRMFTFRMVAE